MPIFRKSKNSAFADGDYLANDTTVFERTRGNAIDNAFVPLSFGGSLVTMITGTGVQAIEPSFEVKLNASQEVGTDGYVFTAVVIGYVEDVTLSMIPEVWDYTTIGSPVLVTAGSAITALTPTRQEFIITSHSSSTKYYRLLANKSTGSFGGWLTGCLERSVP